MSERAVLCWRLDVRKTADVLPDVVRACQRFVVRYVAEGREPRLLHCGEAAYDAIHQAATGQYHTQERPAFTVERIEHGGCRFGPLRVGLGHLAAWEMDVSEGVSE